MTKEKGLSLATGLSAITLFVLVYLVFGTQHGLLGFYSDDATFLNTLPYGGFQQFWQSFLQYVPGRNLHIVWQKLLLMVAGPRLEHLGNLHLIQTLIDGVCVLLFQGVARRIGLRPFAAFAAAALFAFVPNHGETHYWLSAAPMNLMSTLFILWFLYLVLGDSKGRGFRSVLQVLVFGSALFTYDQGLFILLVILGLKILGPWRSTRLETAIPLAKRAQKAFLTLAPYFALSLIYVALKIKPASGPVLGRPHLSQIWKNFLSGWSLTAGEAIQNHTQLVFLKSDAPERILAGVTAIVVFILLAALMYWERKSPAESVGKANSRGNRSEKRVLQSILVVGLGTVLYLTGFLPSYLWSISPRHCYLPTVGFFLALGAAIDIVLTLALKTNRVVQVLVLLPLILSASGLTYLFAASDLREKRDWIESYQLRNEFYSRASRQLESEKHYVLYEGFPGFLGVAPFFAQENYEALNYLFHGKVNYIFYSLAPIPSPKGYFLATEFDRWGQSAVFHISPKGTLHFRWEGVKDGAIQFKTREFSEEAYKEYYKIVKREDLKEPTSLGISKFDERSGVISMDNGLLGSAFDQRVAREEQVAVVFNGCDGQSSYPVHFVNSTPERVQIPVLLEVDLGFKGQKFTFSLEKGIIRKLCSANIYQVTLNGNTSTPLKLLRTVPITQSKNSEKEPNHG